MKTRRGFTLIEVLLSVTILATLSMLAARAISQAVKAKMKIQDQIDDVSRMRDALRLMERDINLAYHYRDIELELNELVKKQGNSKGTAPPSPPAGGSPPPSAPTPAPTPDPSREMPRKDPTTLFMGTGENLNFVTMNHVHMQLDAREADFAEVGYSLKDCQSADGKRRSKCLWRRSSPLVDNDVLLGGNEVVLLENVTEFALKYIGKGKQDWVTEWKSDSSGDAVTKDRFPQAVEISLTVQKETANRGKKKYSMQIVASVHFPNNKDTENSGNNQGGSNGIPAGP